MSGEEIRLCAIMHAEIAKPDALLALGKEEAGAAFAQFRETIRAAAEEKSGRFLESSHGEAVVAFDTSAAAISAALLIQQNLKPQIKAKIGINIGDVLFTSSGGAVGSAADIAEELVRALPAGGICVSAAAWHASPSVDARTIHVQLELPTGVKLDAYRIETGEIPSSEAGQANTRTAESLPLLDTIKRAIFEEIKSTGRRPSIDETWSKFGSYGEAAWDVISSLAAKGILTDRTRYGAFRGDEVSARIEEKIKKKMGPRITNGLASYREELSKTANRLNNALVPSAISFVGINAALWYVNMTYANTIPWAAPVTAMWFFGFLKRIARSIQSRRLAREAEQIQSLDNSQLKEYKAINKERVRFLSRFFSFFSVSSLLFFINIIADEHTPWFIIPTAIMGISLLAHSIDYKVKMPGRLRRFFESLGPVAISSSAISAKNADAAAMGQYTAVYNQAASDAETCLAAFKKISPEELPEAEKSVHACMDQIRLLATTLNELDGLVASMPLRELEIDRTAIEAKKKTASPALAADYDKSISEIDAQRQAHQSLLERKESLEIKLHSMSNQFRQLSLDLASAHAVDAQTKLDSQHAALATLSKRAEEIRASIEDLRTGSDDWLSMEIEKLSQNGA
jgi:hypothetical protein